MGSGRALRAALVSGSHLDVRLPGLTRGEAEALVEKAHQICPYSNATRTNVAVKLGLIEA